MSERLDLRKSCQETLARPRLRYSFAARFFFFAMDLVTGKETTLSKAKLIETLASIPYRAWEGKKYVKLSLDYAKDEQVKTDMDIVEWSRWAQDNEYGHLLVLEEKMRHEGIKDAWYLGRFIRWAFITKYRLFSWLFARISLRAAWRFNGEFEDHAEHVYAQAVADHPEWDLQAAIGPYAEKFYPGLTTWGDVVRQISLDERHHRDKSFELAQQA
jgi:Alternative oxidase